MVEPAPINTTDLLITLADQMADLLRARQSDNLDLPLLDEYQRASQTYTVIADRIQTFNRAVSAGFETNDPSGLQPLLTQGGFQRMLQNFSRWRAAGIRELVLEGCEMLSLQQPADSGGQEARALTLESWVFVSENGERRPEISLNMYTLRLDRVLWKVEAVEFYTKG